MGTNPISPKVTASTLAAAVASLVMVVITVVRPDALTETQVATVQGALVTVVTALLGFLVADPRRSKMSAAPDAVIQSYERAVNDLEPRTGNSATGRISVDPTPPPAPTAVQPDLSLQDYGVVSGAGPTVAPDELDPGTGNDPDGEK